MSKVYLTGQQKLDEIIRFNMRFCEIDKNGNKLSADNMGAIIGSSRTTWHRRLKKPSELTIREIQALCCYFKIDINSFITRKLER